MASARFHETMNAHWAITEARQRPALYRLQKDPNDDQARAEYDFWQDKMDRLRVLMRRGNDGESDRMLRPDFERITSMHYTPERREGG